MPCLSELDVLKEILVALGGIVPVGCQSELDILKLILANIGGGGGSGNVTGEPPTTDNAIVRWDGTTGTFIQNGIAIEQDSGAIEAQAFITTRAVTADVSVTSGKTWIAPEIELELTGSIELEVDAEMVIV